MVTGTTIPQARFTLTANQKRGFLAAWGGWALDGMDSFIYALVLTSALTELLPRSGIAATPVNIGYYGSILGALFLFGWGLSMVWGPIGDRIGRVRALMLTILCYSLFTFLCGLVTNIWQLAMLRVLCGIGIGGEQPVGATYIAEELDEQDSEDRRRVDAHGLLFRLFLRRVGEQLHRRQLRLALDVRLRRSARTDGGLHPLRCPRVEEVAGEVRRRAAGASDDGAGIRHAVHAEVQARHVGDVGVVPRVDRLLWAGSILVPTAANQMARAAGSVQPMRISSARIPGMCWPSARLSGAFWCHSWLSRSVAVVSMAIFLTTMGIAAVIGFGYVFYQPGNTLPAFFVCVFFMGLGGGNFANYTIWLPELYTTDCRASAIGFISSIGRFAGVGMTFLVAWGIRSYGSLGVPVAVVAMAFVVGLLILPFAKETKGHVLPA